jgi:hypothetical protein
VRSTDLVKWTKLVLPGRSAEDWPWYQVDSNQIIATSSRYDGPGGSSTRYVMWRSVDEGRTFQALPDIDLAGGAPILLEGKLVRVPQGWYDHSTHRDATGIAVADPGGSFEQFPPDVGQWGDGAVGVGPFASANGETYSLVSRELRASPHYCFADAATCKTQESSLAVTADGINWRDVVGPNVSRQFYSEVDVRSDGEIVLWGIDGQQRTIVGYRWLGVDPPERRDPPGYPPPSIPLPLYGSPDPLPIGTQVRYVLGTGGCGGMYIERTLWEPIDPLPDPIPATWPYRAVMIADGPEGYLYGRVERVSSRRIEFSIEGIGTVATFRPAPPPEFVCG